MIEIGSLKIPTYILIISSVYCFCLIWIVRRAEKKGFDRNITLDFALAIMLGGFVGARMLHVLWEAPGYYIARPAAVFEIWRGGFVFFGGVIGAFLASEWVFRRHQIEHGPWQDLFTPLFPLGYAIGRLSCLAAGCCYGRPTALPWGIIFPDGVEATPHIPLHPTQLYAFFWEIALFTIILLFDRKRPQRLATPGSLFFLWLLGHGIGRLMMEYFRADHRGNEILGLSISSILSLILIVVSALILLNKQKNWTLFVESPKL